jgi:isopentenyl diphosphate isomerase/L-lactate dehydrogenase-like FMN-dependent dehydrogenase
MDEALGSSRLFHPRGEEVAARAAGAAGTTYILSTLSGCRMEDVRAASTGPAWYQLYLVGGHEAALAGIERARAAGFSALVVTIDTPVAGNRERDLRNGTREIVGGSSLAKVPFLSQFLIRPRWVAGLIGDGGMMKFPNVVIPGEGPMAYAEVGAALAQAMVAWRDFAWIREAWKGPIVVKGWADDQGLRLEVRDEGAGLKEGELERLFEPFYRGEVFRTHVAGTGMGLAITRGLVAADGGRVWAENLVPRGACFSIAVPGATRGIDGAES